MTTPTKLEIDHAERFEKLGLFKYSEYVLFDQPENPFVVKLRRDIVEQHEAEYVIGPLPLCEEIWPVIFSKCDRQEAFDLIEDGMDIIMDQLNLPGAMRETCLTLFEGEG